MKNLTTISEFSDAMKKHFECKLLHEHVNIIGEDLKIRTVCKTCTLNSLKDNKKAT